ncbi:MAG: hypothetical protein JRH11_23430, partial [Deltaproteobacteria bacterium]|nr:hypothetical protein [Deltaproteobacteria bacterium]
GGSIVYQTVGTAPNRQFVTRWDTEHYSSSPTNAVFTSVLNEGSGDVQVCYYETSFGTATYDHGLGATIGINNGPGADGLQFSCNTASLSNGLYIQYIHP